MTYWENKLVVVTGGSAGLGYEIAQALVRRRAKVALVARDESKLQLACERLGELAFVLPADVTNQSQVDQLASRVLEQLGAVNALMNCAGQSTRGEILDTTPEDFQKLWELNFLGLVRCTRAFMPSLLQTKGHLVNIGSLASKSVSRYLGAYPASKFPVAAYSQQLRLELSERGIHVLLACPGPIARIDAGQRYDHAQVPSFAQQPGGGVKLKGLDPVVLAEKILVACEQRRPELVIPAKARLLFALSQISPRLGDWLVRKMTS